jgi:acetoin utilization deacetylase AcuC-like enzyme
MRGLGSNKLAGVPPRSASEDELLLCHTRPYIATAQRDVAMRGTLSTGDTNVGPRSYEVALRAVGTCLNAVDLVMRGEAENALAFENAFAIVRPPGHHASQARGMGFCLFNNIAIAARYAQKQYGVERVAIADWDVHHGNGTQDIFYDDGSVFFFSTHQSPWYPGTGDRRETGEGDGTGKTLNRPLPAGSGFEEIGAAFRNDFAQAMDDFKPDLLLISAGFDSRKGDPLGHFLLGDEHFAELTRLVREIADKYAHRRVVSVLEGGYNLTGLTNAVAAHAEALK